MRIGELAGKAGVSTDTIRLYEKRGLLRSARRGNGYRDFPEGSERLLRMIRLAQRLGFSLSEIADIALPLVDGESVGREEVARLLTDKIDNVERRARDLMELRDLLKAALVDACPLEIAGTLIGARPTQR